MSIMNDKIMLFVKFGEEKYIRRLFNNRIYFSNAGKFRGIEKKNGLKGQGDAYEAIWQLKNSKVFLINERMGWMRYLPNCNFDLQFEDVSKTPIFCITYITSDECSLSPMGNKRILRVNDDIKATIIKHFPKADTAGVFFQPQQFADSLAKLGLTFHDKVEYFDFSPNGCIEEMVEYMTKHAGTISKHNHLIASTYKETDDGKRSKFQITEQNMNRILFCKDCYFAGEKEYRVILPQKRISTPKEFTIRWGKQKRKMYPIDEFFNGIEL